MSQSKIAVNLYTCRDFTQTPGDIADTLHQVKTIGYDYVQVSGLGPVDPQEVKRMLEAEGLGVCATHVAYERLQKEIDTVIAEHHLWDCPNAAISVLPEEYRNPEGYARFAQEGSQIARALAAADLTFSYHNHYWELQKQNHRTGLQILLEDSDPEVFFFEIDTYWIQYAGGDPAAWIRSVKGRIPLVHLKDMGIRDTEPTTFEIGEGNLNWPAVLQACQEAGVQWYIVEQDWCPGDPFDSIATSYRNLRAMGLA